MKKKFFVKILMTNNTHYTLYDTTEQERNKRWRKLVRHCKCKGAVSIDYCDIFLMTKHIIAIQKGEEECSK